MTNDTDALLTPPGSGETFGKLTEPERAVLVETPADMIRWGLRRPTRRQTALLASAAVLAVGAGALVVWVAKRS